MYVDTSVLVKLFVREPDSEFYGNLVDGQPICSSVLAYTEVWSTLLAKERAGGLTKAWRQKAWAAFEGNVRDEFIEMTPMGPAIFHRANRILEKCHPKIPLRTLDALHLATADQVQDWPLVTQDARMRSAAVKLEFPISELARP
jgi:predicted nucleic acid-binding protein